MERTICSEREREENSFMKTKKSHYELKQLFRDMESHRKDAIFDYIAEGMQMGTVSHQEMRQAGLIAKDLLYDMHGHTLLPDTLTGYDERLLRLVMASLLPTAQALACMAGAYWQIDRESLEKACVHAGQYHVYLYTIIEQAWCLRVCAPVWTTADVRELRKRALKMYKTNPSPDTARAVSVSLLPPAEAQTLMESGSQLTPAQLRTATHRAPSPTYERAVAEYADALENA